jgi:MOSC domain-containing protein YiiM
MLTGRIFQLARSPGGVPKLGVHEAQVTPLGLEGDGHAHPKHHGGPERALSLYSLELIQKLQAEGHPIFPGSTGENVTISGLDWSVLNTGTQLWLGEHVLVEITKTAAPCKLICASFVDEKFQRLEVPGEMRWYTRVLRTGPLRIGDRVTVKA